MLDPTGTKYVLDPSVDRQMDQSMGALNATVINATGLAIQMSNFIADQVRVIQVNQGMLEQVKAAQGIDMAPLAEKILDARSVAAQPYVSPTPVVVSPPVKTA